MRIAFAGAAVLALSSASAIAAPGGYRLDPAFGDRGVRFSDAVAWHDGAEGSQLQGMARLRDGRLLVWGVIRCAMSCRQPVIVRYTPSGTLDSTFGRAGRAVFDGPSSMPRKRFEGLSGAMVLSDGRLLISTWQAGRDDESSATPALALFDVNGNLVPDFGEGGVRLTDSPRFSVAWPVGAGYVGAALAPAVQGTTTGAQYVYEPDPTLANAPTPGTRALALTSLGGVVVRSAEAVVVGANRQALVRVGVGLRASAYSVVGRTTSIAVPGAVRLHARTSAAGTSGRVYIGAEWSRPRGTGFVVAAFRADGAADHVFGQGGILRISDPLAVMATGRDGRLVVAERVRSNTTLVRRFTSAGRPDRAFPPVRVRLDVEDMDPSGIVVDPLGRIVLVAGVRDHRPGKGQHSGLAFVRLAPARRG